VNRIRRIWIVRKRNIEAEILQLFRGDDGFEDGEISLEDEESFHAVTEHVEITNAEIELINNIFYGVIESHNKWIKEMQCINFTLYELSVWWRRMKDHCVDIQLWRSHIHEKCLKEVSSDGNKDHIQKLRTNFAVIIQSRSLQFNDLLISLVEHFDPKFKEASHLTTMQRKQNTSWILRRRSLILKKLQQMLGIVTRLRIFWELV
jgi:hypothetical protein